MYKCTKDEFLTESQVVLGNPAGFLQVNPGWAGHPAGFLQVNPDCAGWVTLPGSSRLILVGLGNLRFLQINPGWAG